MPHIWNSCTYIIEHSLMPELTMLEDELERHGEEDILEKYPQLTYIVKHLDCHILIVL